LGLLCWWAKLPAIVNSLEGKCIMILGIDVFHSKMNFIEERRVFRQRRSLGAFVAVTIVPPKGSYRTYCDIVPTEARQEIIGRDDSETESVKSMGSTGDESKAPQTELEGPEITRKNALRDFIIRSSTQFRPDIIIVYRDGVSDAQVNLVEEFELKQVHDAVPGAKVIFTVIQKSSSQRYILKHSDTNEIGNPPQGTIYNGLRQGKPDFYMIPTKSSLSTVKPVRYIIVEYPTENIFPLDQFQTLTYTMCHLYPNWTDVIKLPFPTMLAHKLAKLIGETKVLNPTIHRDLVNKYFYL